MCVRVCVVRVYVCVCVYVCETSACITCNIVAVDVLTQSQYQFSCVIRPLSYPTSRQEGQTSVVRVRQRLHLHAHEVFVEVYFNINVLTWCMDCSGRSKYVVLHVPLRIYIIHMTFCCTSCLRSCLCNSCVV